jgi:hypothetical protein
MKKIKLFSLIFAFAFAIKVNGQVSTLGNASPLFPPAPFVGWDGTGPGGARHLDEKNFYANRNINFFTNGTATNGTSVQRMTIIGSAGATQGFVGIGNGFLAPNQLLTVDAGNINVQNAIQNNGYMIGNQMTM